MISRCQITQCITACLCLVIYVPPGGFNVVTLTHTFYHVTSDVTMLVRWLLVGHCIASWMF